MVGVIVSCFFSTRAAFGSARSKSKGSYTVCPGENVLCRLAGGAYFKERADVGRGTGGVYLLYPAAVAVVEEGRGCGPGRIGYGPGAFLG